MKKSLATLVAVAALSSVFVPNTLAQANSFTQNRRAFFVYCDNGQTSVTCLQGTQSCIPTLPCY